MEISIIIPVYNGEKTILETLGSIAQQSLDFEQTECELIVIDDGSIDSTGAVVQGFIDSLNKDKNSLCGRLIRVDNGGVSKARNIGASLAKGRYLTFIDADDLWTTDKLEAQYQSLEENSNAGFVYSWVNSIDLNGNFLRRGGYLTVDRDPWLQLLIIDVVESGSNVMIRRSFFERVHGFDEALTHSEDWDLWIRLAEQGDVVTVPVPQVLYRQGGNTASTNVRKMESGSLQIIRREGKKLRKRHRYILHQSLANRYKILAFEAMDGEIQRGRAWLALTYGAKAVVYDPQLLNQCSNLWRFLLKCLAIALLPRFVIAPWLNRRQDWNNLEFFFLAAIQVNF